MNVESTVGETGAYFITHLCFPPSLSLIQTATLIKEIKANEHYLIEFADGRDIS